MLDSKGRLAIEQTRNNIQAVQRRTMDLAETAATATPVSGKFMVNNAGEAKADIVFPVRFADIPYITFGFEILGNQPIIDGHAPAMSAYVYDWSTIDRPPFSRFYKGANIFVVSTGPPALKFIVNWTAIGTAFTSPSI